jgi:hypothetical protein
VDEVETGTGWAAPASTGEAGRAAPVRTSEPEDDEDDPVAVRRTAVG